MKHRSTREHGVKGFQLPSAESHKVVAGLVLQLEYLPLFRGNCASEVFRFEQELSAFFEPHRLFK